MFLRIRLFIRIVRALWSIGILSLRPSVPLAFVRAWWRCGNSYACLAELAAFRFPDHCAVEDEGGRLTFAELQAGAQGLALALRNQHHLRPGQRVALLCRNHRDVVIALIALSRLGVDVLLLGTESPWPVWRRILAAESPQLILHDAELANQLAACTTPRQVIAIAPSRLPLRLPPRLPRVRRAGRILVLTSGSTGTAKSIARRPTLGGLLPALAGLLEALPLQLHAPAVAAIPLYHGFGLAVIAMALTFGSPLYLARRCEIAPLLGRVPKGSPPAALISIPTLLQRWLDSSDEAAIVPLAAVISGSAPLSPRLCRRLLDRLGPRLYNLYGSTEAGIIALATPEALLAAPGTVGQPLAGNRVRIAPAKSGLGEIQVQGPLVLATRGWYATGDLGRMDEHGRLFVCGRADSMLISGGENLYPCETETSLLEHPDLTDAAVSVIDDPEFGQALCAWVVTRTGITIDRESLRNWLRQRLERFKLPRQILQVPAIPRNLLGKVDRGALAALEPYDES